jgi:hypothetical protein
MVRLKLNNIIEGGSDKNQPKTAHAMEWEEKGGGLGWWIFSWSVWITVFEFSLNQLKF